MQNMSNAAPMPLASPPGGVLLRILGGVCVAVCQTKKCTFKPHPLSN